MAKYLLDNYQTLDIQSQNKILTNLDQLLKQDHSFFEQALIKQVKNHVTQASLLYETREQLKLQQLLMSLTPAASILLNIEVSLGNQTYHDEGNTLSYTLLPFINQVTDFSYLSEEANFILTRFLVSLARHIVDVGLEVEVGFMLFALKYDPSQLKEMLHFGGNRCKLV